MPSSCSLPFLLVAVEVCWPSATSGHTGQGDARGKASKSKETWVPFLPGATCQSWTVRTQSTTKNSAITVNFVLSTTLWNSYSSHLYTSATKSQKGKPNLNYVASDYLFTAKLLLLTARKAGGRVTQPGAQGPLWQKSERAHCCFLPHRTREAQADSAEGSLL